MEDIPPIVSTYPVPVTEPSSDERRELLISAGLKVLGVALGISLAIGVGAFVVVKGLGLDSTEVGPSAVTPVRPIAPLPSSALPVPTDSPSAQTTTPTATPTPTLTEGALALSASPSVVTAMERINLTGQWPGRDALTLKVQRLEDGQWVDFGVQASVKIGTFATFVMTGRGGPNVFRVVDPDSGTASNQVTVTVE